jgi:hypothetical protein
MLSDYFDLNFSCRYKTEAEIVVPANNMPALSAKKPTKLAKTALKIISL